MIVQSETHEMDSLSTTGNQFPFESQRLRIRRLKNEDFDILYQYRNDEQVAKYQSWTDKSKDEIQALIDEKPTIGTVDEWFTFAIALKEMDQLIGECAFCISGTIPGQAEMGITLSREAQGKRYANEAITAIINFLFKTTTIEEIIFITYLDNKPCINLLSKLKATQQIDYTIAVNHENLRHYGLKETEILFSLLKEKWL